MGIEKSFFFQKICFVSQEKQKQREKVNSEKGLFGEREKQNYYNSSTYRVLLLQRKRTLCLGDVV